MRKYSFAALLLLAVTALTAADYARDFNRSIAVSPYPRDAAKRLKLVPDAAAGANALAMTGKAGQATSIYGFVNLPEQSGELDMEFFHKMTVGEKVAREFNVSLFFNKKKGRQGSAGGSQKLVLESSDKYTLEKRSIPVPAEAASVQFIISTGKGDQTLFLDELKFSFVADSVTVPLGSEAQLKNFYELTRPVKVPTEVRLSADSNALKVKFINTEPQMKSLVAKCSKRDDYGIFSDDCNEVFIYDTGRDKHWQFSANTNGALVDGIRYRRVDGDPWIFDGKWNSGARATAQKSAKGFEITIEIPWKDLGVTFADGLELGLDFCRERKISPENSRWNCGGFFADTGTYANFKIANGKMSIRRHRSAMSMNYTVKRAKPQFESLLQKGVPGNYTAGSWSDGYSKPSLKKKISEEAFAKWQDDLLNAWGMARMEGPFFPWGRHHLIGGLDGVLKYHKRWGMRYPFFTYTSSHRKQAIAEGAKFIAPGKTHVSPIDPAVRDVMIKYFRSVPKWGREYEYMKTMASCVEGPDEPTNALARIFTVTGNPEAAPALKEFSEEIRRDFGFGKYGLPDDALAADENRPFERIAFMRCWNARLRDNYAAWRAEVAKILPGVPFKAANNNTTAGCAPMDYAVIAEASDILGVDPYPTAVTRVFDHARAVHHTGFSVRLLRDLAPKCKIHATLQGFIYHSGQPKWDDLNEWTSQALKNGAETIVWYDASAVRTMFKEYVYMLNLTRMVTGMDKIKLPTETVTGILHSDYDAYALNDISLNPAYSMYVLLGEQLKCNFRYVSPSGIANKTTPLQGLKLLYVPRGAYTTPELTAELRSFVANGGTLVSFDPRFQSWNIDGTRVADRKAFTGADLGAVKTTAQTITYNRQTLKLAENRHVKMPTGFTVESYDLANISSKSKVIAAYPDGRAAAIETPYGKGKVILFACQPFGSAALSLEPGKWMDFFRAQAKAAGEKVDLPIWDFTLPKAPEEIKLVKNW